MREKKALNKRILVKYLSKELGIKYSYISDIINLLIEELGAELLLNNKFDVANFGTFEIKKINSRRHFNWLTKQVTYSKSSKKLNFKLSKKMIILLKNN